MLEIGPHGKHNLSPRRRDLSGLKQRLTGHPCERDMEQWRPVVGFEGLYEVSDLGRVRSLPRETPSTWVPWKINAQHASLIPDPSALRSLVHS